MGNDAICVGRIIQKEQVLMQGQRTLEEGLRNGIRNGEFIGGGGGGHWGASTMKGLRGER